MSKRVLAIETSPRKHGNTEMMAEKFLKGAEEAGHKTEKISLYDRKIQFCRGCLACQTTKECVIKDDMSTILGKIQEADVLVFSTPIYFYEMTGQMKTLLDRTNPLFPAEYEFRDVYLLAACADTEETSADGAVKGLKGWIDCFGQARLAGVLCGYGAEEKGDIEKMPEILSRAYGMGKEI
ncbi:flavodoxin family protein [Anaerostipes sp.]|uniref:flavodoxin family protein n=1 Tax=Anaerostipes sp. TaxID=1872530 RepID=UPI0025BD39BB|nr:flavodoxin family protein [Anaerostipes sp.]MBS7008686.1 flavodoxin family protein [Anaerostipes sp.]